MRPAGIVLLGATAAAALAGPEIQVMRDHGRPQGSSLAPVVIATIHPSAVLRARGDDRERSLAMLVDDLRTADRAAAAGLV
jgi:DNA polymerase